jgi:ADP-ribosylglycohydrolase
MNPQDTMNRLHDRILGSLSLAGMGDALGAPTEQWSIDEIEQFYGGLVTTFHTPPEDTFAGANNGRRAEVTDDASQMYYLARALIGAGGSLDRAGWLACLLDWVDTCPKATFMGPSTAAIVKAIKEGSDLSLVGVIGGSHRKMTTVGTTNGAAMRIAPAGLVHPGQIEAACQQAFITCFPSHDTDVAISAACSIAAATSVALLTDSLDEVIAAAVQGGYVGERLASQGARLVAGPRYNARLRLALSIASDAASDREFMTRIEEVVGNSVLAAESVPAALAVVAYAKGDPLRTIAIASSMGNDTDSIATMAGGIVGALVGNGRLPVGLLKEFRAANAAEYDLDAMADGLCDIALQRVRATER